MQSRPPLTTTTATTTTANRTATGTGLGLGTGHSNSNINENLQPFAFINKKRRQKLFVRFITIATVVSLLAYVFIPRKCRPLPPAELINLARQIPRGQDCLYVPQRCTLVFSTSNIGAVTATPAGPHVSALFLPKITSQSAEKQQYVTQKGRGIPVEKTGPKQLILAGGGASTVDSEKQYNDVFVLSASTAACVFDVLGDA